MKHDRERLAEARARGKAEIMLLIASRPGTNGIVASLISSFKGIIRYRDDQVDYIRAKVPIDQVEKIARGADIEALNIDGELQYRYSTNSNETVPAAAGSNTFQKMVNPISRNTPPENPYLPTRDIGAPQFTAAFPTFDGRGVTIAFIESFPDLLSPELQGATTLDGKPIQKVAGLLSAIDPIDDENEYQVAMQDQVLAEGGHFAYKSAIYHAPADSSYRIGFFNERTITYPYLERDINRDGNPTGSNGLFAVLWNEQTNTVWVDTNQNFDFTDEKAMTDYNEHHDFGVFGKDDPDTPLRETVAFIVQINSENRSVCIYPAADMHSTNVASVAAGKGFFGGQANGVAPGAQLIFVRFRPVLHGAIEAMILAAKNSQVDIITSELGNVSRLNDGSSTLSIIWDRLAEKYKKLIFSSAGNRGPGTNTVSEISSGNKVISVGGYIHRDTLLSNYSITTNNDDYVMNLSSRGPREDGGLKPDIIAPAAALEASPAIYPGDAPKGSFKILPGYRSVAGTSNSAPMVAGGAALLISAAKQSDVAYDVNRLRWAITSSARHIPGYGVHEQGRGIFQVNSAWTALKSAPEVVEIASRAPVNTTLSRHLRESNQGPGIYEREGWVAGQSGRRAISFIRSSGPSTPLTYNLRWLGNDGTFECPETITLPLNTQVTILVTISPKKSGIHSALLSLVDQSGAYNIYQVMNTIIAAEQFTLGNRFTVLCRGQIEYPGKSSYFFYIQNGTFAIKFKMHIIKGSVRLRFIDPSGKEYDFSRPGTTFAPYQYTEVVGRVITNPDPGVWEVIVENSDLEIEGPRSFLDLRADVALSVSVLGVESKDLERTFATDLKNTGSRTKEVVSLNRYSSFRGGIVSVPLGSGFAARPTLVDGGPPKIYEVDLPSGAERLITRIDNASDGTADIDLYLYECISQECILRDFSIGSGSKEVITVANPSPGKWKVVIDPVLIPAGRTSIEYLDIFTHQSFGMLRSTDTSAARVSGGSWNAKIIVEGMTIPAKDRCLCGIIEVADEESDIVGYWYDKNTFSGKALRNRAAMSETIIEITDQCLHLEKIVQ